MALQLHFQHSNALRQTAFQTCGGKGCSRCVKAWEKIISENLPFLPQQSLGALVPPPPLKSIQPYQNANNGGQLKFTYFFLNDNSLSEGLIKAGEESMVLEEGRSSGEHGVKPLRRNSLGDLKKKTQFRFFTYEQHAFKQW